MKLTLVAVMALMLFTGCATTNIERVTSTPPGARVYNARGVSQCDSGSGGYRPYDHIQGTYRGVTPVYYEAAFYGYDNVRVVWPDGEDSGWMQKPTGFGKDCSFHFTKRKANSAPATPNSGRRQSSGATVTETSEKLAVLKALRERGDIAEEEYIQRRNSLLDAISATPAKPLTSQVQRQSDSEMRSVAAVKQESMALADSIAESRGRFRISAHIEDDPAKGDEILGNGDGLIQKGEAFDLVVVVANISTSTAKDVTCTVTLLEDEYVKAYGELEHAAGELAPAVSMTNRFNLVAPLSGTITAALACKIEVKEGGSPVVEQRSYMLPADLSVLTGAEHQVFVESSAGQSSKGGETYEDIPAVAMPISGTREAASVPESEVAPPGIVRVIGEVKNPGEIGMTDARDLTLLAVIAKAGGLTTFAAPGRIRIIHRLADGKLEVRKVNVATVIRNGNVTVDVQLEAGDTVMVPERFF